MDLIMTGISASERQRRENLVAATRNHIVEKMQVGGPSMRMIEVMKLFSFSCPFFPCDFIITRFSGELIFHSGPCTVAGRTSETELYGNPSARCKSELSFTVLCFSDSLTYADLCLEIVYSFVVLLAH